MKVMIFVLALCLTRYAVGATTNHAVLFIDSARPEQAAMIEALNSAFFFSASLRAGLKVTAYDINTDTTHRGFSGDVDYRRDFDGKAVAQMRPGALPYLFCLRGGQRIVRQLTIGSQEEIKLCLGS